MNRISSIRNKRIEVCLFAGLLILAGLPQLRAQASGKWERSLEFYGMGSSIDGTASVGRAVGVPVDLGFGDILDNLELAGMAHFEAFNTDEKWGFMLDYGFMDLGKGKSGIRGVADIDVHQSIFEAVYFRRTVESGFDVDYYVGLRMWDNEIDLVLDSSIRPGTRTPSLNRDWFDLFIGARAFIPLTPDWTLTYHADIGGLDMESQLTYSGSIGLLYNMAQNWALDIKYKGLWVDYRDGIPGRTDSFEYDAVTYGPIIGIIKKF